MAIIRLSSTVITVHLLCDRPALHLGKAHVTPPISRFVNHSRCLPQFLHISIRICKGVIIRFLKVLEAVDPHQARHAQVHGQIQPILTGNLEHVRLPQSYHTLLTLNNMQHTMGRLHHFISILEILVSLHQVAGSHLDLQRCILHKLLKGFIATHKKRCSLQAVVILPCQDYGERLPRQTLRHQVKVRQAQMRMRMKESKLRSWTSQQVDTTCKPGLAHLIANLEVEERRSAAEAKRRSITVFY